MKKYRTAFIAAASLTAMLLSACESGVNTRIEVKSATETPIIATVRFTAEAAEQLHESEELNKQLVDLIENRTGEKAEREGDEKEIIYTVELTYDKMVQASDILGIAGATLEGKDDDTVTLSVNLVKPAGLQEAIQRATSTQEDAEILAETIFKTTSVNLQIDFDGGVKETTGPYETTEEDGVVTLEQTLTSFQDGTLTIAGDPAKSFLQAYQKPLIAGAAVALLLGAVVVARKRSLNN